MKFNKHMINIINRGLVNWDVIKYYIYIIYRITVYFALNLIIFNYRKNI